MNERPAAGLPCWVPDGARRYLAHTEEGWSIRRLARVAGCHASTVLRQIRSIEMRRDDPLVDASLSALALAHFSPDRAPPGRSGAQIRETAPMTALGQYTDDTLDTDRLSLEAERILRRLSETGALLAVAEEMEKAVVVRDAGDGTSTRTAVVDAEVAQAMALKGWIACDAPGRISRYQITAGGRTALNRLVARSENRARSHNDHGFAETQAGFVPFSGGAGRAGDDLSAPQGGRAERSRHHGSESPLATLARRKDRDGSPFLSPDLVHAGERLREDFELQQMGTSARKDGAASAKGRAATAQERVAQALAELGPGLGDVALRCCCYLEGLERVEKRMGWSARSGKIVLRIALQRLRQHYDSRSEADRMIG